MKNIRFILIVLACIGSNVNFAATRYWLGTTSTSWSNSANWSASLGGTAGATVPTHQDHVIFEASSNNCLIDPVTADMKSLTVKVNYDGAISSTSDKILVRNSFVLNGGTSFIFNSTPEWLFIYGNVDISNPAMFNSNGGTVWLVGTQSQTVTCAPAWNLHDFWVGAPNGNYYPSYTIAPGTRIDVQNLLLERGTRPIRFEGDIWLYGDLLNENTAAPNGGIVRDFAVYLKGNANQTIQSTSDFREGTIGRLVIDKDPSSTVTMDGKITVQRELSHISGIVDASNVEMVLYASSQSSYDSQYDIFINGNWIVKDLHLWPAAHLNKGLGMSVGSDIVVSGDVYTLSNRRWTFKQGDIRIKGDMHHFNYWGTILNHMGNGTYWFDGTGDQKFVTAGVNSAPGRGLLPNVSIVKPSGVFTIEGNLTLQGDFFYDASLGGVFDGITNDPTLALTPITSKTQKVHGNSFAIGNLTYITGANMVASNGTIDPNLIVTVKNDLTIANTGGRRFSLYGGTINVEGDVKITNNFAGSGNAGNAWIAFTGTGVQQFDGNGQGICRLPNVRVNKSSGHIEVTDAPNIDGQLELISGILKYASVPDLNEDYIYMNTLSSATGGSAVSHSEVKIKKFGSNAFTFPVGKGGVYRPIAITAPGSNATFEAEYFNTPQTFGTILQAPLLSISTCDYWILDRTSGSANVKVNLGWDAASCDIDSPSDMQIGRWNGTQWANEGNTSSTGNSTIGSVTSTNISSFSPFILASLQPLVVFTPSITYATLQKSLDGGYYETSNCKFHFKFDEEYNDQDGKLSYKFFDRNGAEINSVYAVNPTFPVSYGDNRYTLTIPGIMPGYYILEVENEKHEIRKLRIRHRTSGLGCATSGGPPGGVITP